VGVSWEVVQGGRAMVTGAVKEREHLKSESRISRGSSRGQEAVPHASCRHQVHG
jgi:hypothetical protein